MDKLPNPQEAIEIAEKLIAGEITPHEAENWALPYVSSVDDTIFYKNFDETKIALMDLIDALAMAANTHDGKVRMYAKESYQEWLDEYLRSIKD